MGGRGKERREDRGGETSESDTDASSDGRDEEEGERCPNSDIHCRRTQRELELVKRQVAELRTAEEKELEAKEARVTKSTVEYLRGQLAASRKSQSVLLDVDAELRQATKSLKKEKEEKEALENKNAKLEDRLAKMEEKSERLELKVAKLEKELAKAETRRRSPSSSD